MLASLIETAIHFVQSLFGNIFIVCAGISLILLILELIWYRVKATGRK